MSIATCLHLDWGGAVRQRSSHPDAGNVHPIPPRTLRCIEVVRRGVRQYLGELLAPAPYRGEAGQRLRAPSEPPWRGGSGGDIQSRSVEWRAPADVRSGQADPRLHPCRRRGRGSAPRHGDERNLQRRYRHRDLGGGSLLAIWPKRPAARSSPSGCRSGKESSNGPAWIPPLRSTNSDGAPAFQSQTGSCRPIRSWSRGLRQGSGLGPASAEDDPDTISSALV